MLLSVAFGRLCKGSQSVFTFSKKAKKGLRQNLGPQRRGACVFIQYTEKVWAKRAPQAKNFQGFAQKCAENAPHGELRLYVKFQLKRRPGGHFPAYKTFSKFGTLVLGVWYFLVGFCVFCHFLMDGHILSWAHVVFTLGVCYVRKSRAPGRGILGSGAVKTKIVKGFWFFAKIKKTPLSKRI